MLTWPPKDPDEILDYTLDWSERLADDSIATSAWVDPPSGVTIDSDDFDVTTTLLWLSGGTADEQYVFTNRITTAGGRTMDQSVRLKVKTR